MSKQLAQFNENEYNAIISDITGKIECLQSFVDAYNKTGLKPLNGTNELMEFFYNSKEFFVKTLTKGEKLTVQNLDLNNEKVFDLINKPKEVTELIEMLKEFNSNKANINFYQIRLYTVTENVISVSTETLNNIRTANSIYIDNEKQKEAFELCNDLLKTLNALNEIKTIHLNNIDNLIKNNNGRFYLEAIFLKSIN